MSAFARGTVRGALPLGVWALHFTVSYGGVAVGCHAGWQRSTWVGLPALQVGLAVFTLAALAWVALLLGHACQAPHRSADKAALLPTVCTLAALLSFIGIAWTSVPLWVLPLCRYS